MSKEMSSPEGTPGTKPSRYTPRGSRGLKNILRPNDGEDGVFLLGIRRTSSCGLLLDGPKTRPSSVIDVTSNSPSSFPDGIGPPPRVIKRSIGDDSPITNGLSNMRHLGKSLDKVSGVCVCTCLCAHMRMRLLVSTL
jgi:hypothetical protein